MSEPKATDFSRAELVQMIRMLRGTLRNVPLDPNQNVELWREAIDSRLAQTAFEDDQQGQEFQVVANGPLSCPFLFSESIEDGLYGQCAFELLECIGFEGDDCPLNKYAEVRVRKSEGDVS